MKRWMPMFGAEGVDDVVDLTVIVPTFNERESVEELVARLQRAVVGIHAEVLFIDDSTDGTAAEVRRAAEAASLPVRVIHRETPDGGLGGAVVRGLREADADLCVVMDGDLQHPPEVIPELFATHAGGDADIVIASRYVGDGTSAGLANASRAFVSKASTALTKAMFPRRLADCTDPMTGFFLVDRRRVALDQLRPNGFKILLEILARNDLRIREVPFAFASRSHGTSKASLRQGWRFLMQVARLRFGKMSLFALIGAVGAVANLAIMWVLTALGVDYIVAAIIAAEATIIGNFVLQERFVFADMRQQASALWLRFVKSFTFNNAEAALRIPVLALMVETWHISSVLAAGITLVLAFIVRFMFHSLVVYAPHKRGVAPSRSRRVLEAIDAEAVKPGEL